MSNSVQSHSHCSTTIKDMLHIAYILHSINTTQDTHTHTHTHTPRIPPDHLLRVRGEGFTVLTVCFYSPGGAVFQTPLEFSLHTHTHTHTHQYIRFIHINVTSAPILSDTDDILQER